MRHGTCSYGQFDTCGQIAWRALPLVPNVSTGSAPGPRDCVGGGRRLRPGRDRGCVSLARHAVPLIERCRLSEVARAAELPKPRHIDCLSNSSCLVPCNTDDAGDAWRRAVTILDDLGHPDADQVRTKLATVDIPSSDTDDRDA